MTIDEVEKTVKQVLNEFRQTMLNEHTSREISQYIIERLHIEKHLKELQKQKQEKEKELSGVK